MEGEEGMDTWRSLDLRETLQESASACKLFGLERMISQVGCWEHSPSSMMRSTVQ